MDRDGSRGVRPADCGVIAVVPFSHLWVASRARNIMERTMPRKIITSYWAKPIPTRAFDWSAHWESREEGPYGYGTTEADAIRDLTENYDHPDQE